MTPATHLVLLAMLMAPGVVKLPLVVLSLQALKVSVVSLSLCAGRPLWRAPVLTGMALLVPVPSSPVLLL